MISCFQIDFYIWVLRFYFLLFSQMSAVIVQERKFCCIWFRFALWSQLLIFVFQFLSLSWTFCHTVLKETEEIMSFLHCYQFYTSSRGLLLIVLSIVALLFIWLKINNLLNPDLVFVVTAHVVYFVLNSLALKYSKKCQGIRDGLQAISFRRQWINNWRLWWKKGARIFTQNWTLLKTLQISHAVLFRCVKQCSVCFFAEVFFVYEILRMQKSLYLWSHQHVTGKTVISLKIQQNIDLLQRVTLKSVDVRVKPLQSWFHVNVQPQRR